MSNRRPESRRPLTTLDALDRAGLLRVPPTSEAAQALSQVATDYAIAVTQEVADLIDRDDPADPIAAQFIPSSAEAMRAPFERDDPIGDAVHSPVPGIVHRYPDRVLLKAASTCPVYCRFCFRREMVGPAKGDALTKRDLDAAIAYIERSPAIWEVIVTGGDPLILSADRIAELGRRLAAIPHVQVIRWHTRVPVVSPDTVTADVATALATPLEDGAAQVYVAVHTNHARELTANARAACRRLASNGISLVSQTVLLRGVNDTRDALADLFRACVATGIKPYYLHQLDPAPGTAHFRVPLAEAQALVQSLRGHISGLCQPTFVVDIPGGAGKAVAGISDIVHDPDGTASARDGNAPVHVRDRHGRLHRYEEAGAVGQSGQGRGAGGKRQGG
jgi:lysine 2,3-aminomutase